MKKLMMIAMMTMACVGIQAQNTVTVQDATNMSAKELKAAAKEQAKKEAAVKDYEKARLAIAKAEKAQQKAEETRLDMRWKSWRQKLDRQAFSAKRRKRGDENSFQPSCHSYRQD